MRTTRRCQIWYWVACYPVTGKSEGYYIHVATIGPGHETGEEKHTIVFLGKTFQGFDFAARVANECARALGT